MNEVDKSLISVGIHVVLPIQADQVGRFGKCGFLSKVLATHNSSLDRLNNKQCYIGKSWKDHIYHNEIKYTFPTIRNMHPV